MIKFIIWQFLNIVMKTWQSLSLYQVKKSLLLHYHCSVFEADFRTRRSINVLLKYARIDRAEITIIILVKFNFA